MEVDPSKRMLRKLRSHMHETVGENFWEDMSGLIPPLFPRMDMYRQDGRFIAVIELPGAASPDKIKISTNGKTLKITGVIPYDYPVHEDRLLRSERSLGSFNRTVSLPVEVEPDSAEAVFESGLLTAIFRCKPDIPEQDVPILPKKEEQT
ncbi:MAG: Hsp20/alpha crystallin family protein [Paenibacillus macerans]|uniref:Hsp20 family protein n=1 Tax=Paenibacillus macerans TaxID=44252 RepID=A0A090YQH6_PAEMA|nr:Hsp20/alpha crystallin family protein [Paenibacillus macerans]KFM94380.1 hsp20/alpha crystallin family protein [Paenibacillus macerans]MBS5909640.1 Hsp20/alpha crystallin family protein [Paenibacillus macerans]MCY7557306.1 Hsp20/alpha crystallin family protein [Paenibacillus macerans]MDU7471770.1 Hsp20/alpha crystallin family protein [Paenibacillus macerans]MEC0136792.1 Hsp20/alpha crystallin family protein [Paenibacillus macerans]